LLGTLGLLYFSWFYLSLAESLAESYLAESYLSLAESDPYIST